MTRINIDIAPSDLTRLHLGAEYRELPMVHAALRRSLKTKSVHQILSEVPKKFTLNKGHIKYFYTKLAFLDKRYDLIVAEMKRRGVDLDPNRSIDKTGIPYIFFGDSVDFDAEDHKAICERIVKRIKEKPHLYEVDVDAYEKKLTEKYCK